MDYRHTPPNRVHKDRRGLYFLYRYQIKLDPKDWTWKYLDGRSVPTSKFWIPQQPNQPPNNAFYLVETDTYYLEETLIYFDTSVKRWTASETGERVPDNFFSGPIWIQGNKSALPKELRTPKATVKDEKKGSFCAPK